jgi:hypothetical protein
MIYLAGAGLLILAALNILQLVLAFRERQKLLDRIQAKTFPEFKAFESKEGKKEDKKEPVKPFELV